MSETDCLVCEGRGVISLPLCRRASLRYDPEATFNPSETVELSREYPCPECGKVVPEARLLVMNAEVSVIAEMAGRDDYMQHVRRQIATMLGQGFLDRSLIALPMVHQQEWCGEFDSALSKPQT